MLRVFKLHVIKLEVMLKDSLHLLDLNISWQYDVIASDGKAVQKKKNSIRDLQRKHVLIVDWNISIYSSVKETKSS